jgi:aldehyde:ferredoxin oxidoreductase
MGMGAVMGSKNLKALIIKDNVKPGVFNKDLLDRITDDFCKRMKSNNLSKWQLEAPGFSCWIYLHGLDAALCTNNYSKSSFDSIDSYKEENFLSRRISDLECPGCPNNCIKSIHPDDSDDLDSRASGIHQEITGTMGPNIGIGNLDMVLRYNNLCNQYGLDPTSLGFCISFAMELFEKGILASDDRDFIKFGDAGGVLELIRNIALRKGLGNILAEGTKRAAALIGKGSDRYAMQVKGLEIVPFEPRSQTNLAMGYAVAPTGPRYDICEHDWDFDTQVGWDHTLTLCRTMGILERIPMNYIGPEKVKIFKQLITIWSAADALDMCIFAIAPTRLLSLPQMAQLLHAVTGWETSDHEIMRIGERRLHLMRWYNQREGITAAQDVLPERFYSEPIGEGPRKGDVIDKENFHKSIRTFYEMLGWDENAIPLRATLYDHGLEWLIEEDIKNDYLK